MNELSEYHEFSDKIWQNINWNSNIEYGTLYL